MYKFFLLLFFNWTSMVFTQDSVLEIFLADSLNTEQDPFYEIGDHVDQIFYFHDQQNVSIGYRAHESSRIYYIRDYDTGYIFEFTPVFLHLSGFDYFRGISGITVLDSNSRKLASISIIPFYTKPFEAYEIKVNDYKYCIYKKKLKKFKWLFYDNKEFVPTMELTIPNFLDLVYYFLEHHDRLGYRFCWKCK